nr:hypothetical protein [Desulfobacterales bacterium]
MNRTEVPKKSLIESIGVYIPPKMVSSEEVLKGCRVRPRVPLERLTGIRVRPMAGEREFAIDLAKKAVEKCLANSKFCPEDIEILICANICRYDGPNFKIFFEPSTSIKLKKHFGFKNAIVFDISNACAGMFTAIIIIDSYIKCGMIKRGMVVSGEYITHLTRNAQMEITRSLDPQFASLTLGDSGAALILEESPDPSIGFHEIDIYSAGRYSGYCIAKPSKKEHGGAVMLTNSIKLHSVAVEHGVRHFSYIMNKNGWKKKRINHFIFHQTAKTAIRSGGARINRYTGENICSPENLIINLAHRGNTSSTTHFVALWDNIINNRINSGDNIVFGIQASGLTIGTATYTLDDLPDRIRKRERLESVDSINLSVSWEQAKPLVHSRIF